MFNSHNYSVDWILQKLYNPTIDSFGAPHPHIPIKIAILTTFLWMGEIDRPTQGERKKEYFFRSFAQGVFLETQILQFTIFF